MPDNTYTFCEGIGCALRLHCVRYTTGLSIDRHAPGYIWIPGCNDEDRNMFFPHPEINK